MDDFISMVLGLVLFVIILGLSFFLAKHVSKKQGLQFGNGSKNIKIIEKCPLSHDKMLVIVKSAGKTMLMGVTNNHIELISELNEDEILLNSDGDKKPMDFAEMLKGIINHKKISFYAENSRGDKE